MPYHVSVGGMQIKGWRAFPQVIWNTYRALAAARAAHGCVEARIFRKGRLYFAVSVWDDAAAMQAYAHQGVHKQLMRHASTWMSSFQNLSYTSETVPDNASAEAAWRVRCDP